MCGNCWGWDDRDCHGWHRGPGYYGNYGYGPRRRYYEEPSPEERREGLEDEKRYLERRLKDLEARIAEASK